MPIRVYHRENAKPEDGERAKAKTFSSPCHSPLPDELDIIHLEFIERDTRHDRAIYNRDIGRAECAWLEHAVGVTTTAILVVGRDKTFAAIDDPRPVSMHENDRASCALSKVNTQPVLGAVPDHAEPSACCPCVVYKALCNAPKYSESRQLSFSYLHAASIERDMHSVDIDCILADAYDAVGLRATGHVAAKDHDVCIPHDMRT
jgi:hypothetical protein